MVFNVVIQQGSFRKKPFTYQGSVLLQIIAS